MEDGTRGMIPVGGPVQIQTPLLEKTADICARIEVVTRRVIEVRDVIDGPVPNADPERHDFGSVRGQVDRILQSVIELEVVVSDIERAVGVYNPAAAPAL